MLIQLLAITVLVASQGETRPSDERVVNGVPVETSRYVVSIHKDRKYQCAGTIIERQFVLTAAHCIDCEDKDSYIIRKGSVNRDKGQIYFVNECESARTNASVNFNDLAVLYIEELEANLDEQAARPYKFCGDCVVGQRFKLYGWGKSKQDDPESSEVLKESSSKLISMAECKYMIGNMSVSESEICTRDGACEGDDGGPLVSSTDYIYGIILSSLRCDLPMIYTNVHKFMKFIDAFIYKHRTRTN